MLRRTEPFVITPYGAKPAESSKKTSLEPQSDMFKPRLEEIVNPAHPLMRLTDNGHNAEG